MKISILHPSRNRAATANATIAEWLGKRSGLHPVEYILSIDTSDGQIAEYGRLAERHGARLIIHPNLNLVQACNRAALVATGDLLIMASDDVGCPSGWDDALVLSVGDQSDVAVLVNDGLGAKTMALPIVGRAFYRQRGYLLFPGYIHHFSNSDLEGLARSLGKLLDARHLLFPHRHYTAGASAYDETYRNADRSWKQGAHLLRKREVRGFNLRTPTLGAIATCARLDLGHHRAGMQRLLRRAVRRAKLIIPFLDSMHILLRNSVKHLGRRVQPSEAAGQERSLGYQCYVAVGHVQGDVSVMEHSIAPSQIVSLRDCIVDRSRVRVRPGGGDMPSRPFPAEWEYAAFEKGALQLRSLCGLNPWHPRGYLQRFLCSTELVGSVRHDSEETVTTFAIERWDYVNLAHVFIALFNTYVAIRLLAGSEPFDLLFLDGHCRGSLDTLWPDILKPKRIRRLHDYPGEMTRFRKLVLVPGEHESPLWYSEIAEPSRSGDFLSDFIATVLAAYQVADRPIRERVLTFVDRRDHKASPQSDGIICRKVDDLDFTISLLRRMYPLHRIDVHCFENIPFGQQLQIVRDSDVLCGVHGAALMHVMFLRPGSELVEFSPPQFFYWPVFSNLARSRGIRYTRYLARTQRVLPNGKVVVKVTDTPA